MKKLILPLVCSLLFLGACSKAPGKTAATLKLKVSGIVNLAGGIGSGGAILFGKSAAGESFGKVVLGAEENLDMPNGDWTFYAVMWSTVDPLKKMNDKVHCAKTFAKLGGGDVTLSLNLTNSNCSDPDFSAGRHYVDPVTGFTRFADLFIEECDDLNSASWFCGQDNHGSALSYRLKFQSFKRAPGTPVLFGGEVLTSACNKVFKADVLDILHKGLEVNFPSGNGPSPFVVSVEMFLGSGTCDVNEAKGLHTVVLNNGLGTPAGINSKVVSSNTNCAFAAGDFPGDEPSRINLCAGYLANVNVGYCENAVLPFISRFAPASACATRNVDKQAIKVLVSIPKPTICNPYNNLSASIGAVPFAAGNGTPERPYKICNEWQHNQIGEVGITIPAPYTDVNLAHYKLLNDLDMNKTDFGPYQKPVCVVNSSVNLDKHHNTNPFPALESSCGTIYDISAANGFQGIYNGNNHTIANVRISTEGASAIIVGFVRKLYGGSQIKNLKFKNMEVRGHDYVGGVAGKMDSSGSKVTNVTIDGLDLENKYNNVGANLGGIASTLGSNSIIDNVVISDAEIRGSGYIGGAVGTNTGGHISRVGFSGHIENTQSGSYIGGVVGYMQSSSTMTNSYSKGLIRSAAQYAGGIVGGNSTGTLHTLYSSMNLITKYTTTNAKVGGIVGNSGMSVTKVFFDGVISNLGGASTFLDSMGNASGNTFCYSTTGPTTISGCSILTYAQARTPANTDFNGSTDWQLSAGALPHLLWEANVCSNALTISSVTNQAANGRGSQSNPILICNPDQITNLSGRPGSEYYKLAEDINLASWTTETPLVVTFNGNLDGNGHSLFGAFVTVAANATPDYMGFFRHNNGVIKNLKLYNNILTSHDEEQASGLITGINNGTIENITSINNTVYGKNFIGGIAGVNNNVINAVDIDDGKVRGTASVGGVAGQNAVDSFVTRASVTSKILNYPSFTTHTEIGGVVGTNNGFISQAIFAGAMTMSAQSSNVLKLGGIAGINTGTISDVYTDNRSKIIVKEEDMVGGLVGRNDGTVDRVMALGAVVYDNAGFASDTLPMHPVVGSPVTATATNALFLEFNIVSVLETNTINSCSGTAPNFTATVLTPTTYLDTADAPGNANMFISNASTPQDDLNHYTYFSSIPANNQFSFSGLSCGAWPITLAHHFPLNYGTGTPKASFASIGTFTSLGFDIVNPANPSDDARLVDYYKSIMYNTTPVNPPIWELSPGDKHPKLVQLDQH